MKMSIQKFLIFISISLFFLSCKNERIELPWTEIDLPTEQPLSDVHFIDQDTGFITAGSDWTEGEILATSDAGENWEIIIENDTRISSLDSDIDGNVYAIGFTGRYFKRDHNGWTEKTFNVYRAYTSISVLDGDNILIAYGNNANDGDIVKLNNVGSFISKDSFPNHLEAVVHINEMDAIACGYGLIIRSNDAGDTWQRIDITGDYYTDVQFPSPEVGYICGYSGSILKSTDGGNSWTFLRNGDKILVPDKRFKAMHFENEDHGYIVGNSGLCWRTEDGGDHWQIIKKLPKYNFTAVQIIEDKAYLTSREGTLIIITHG
jgi:photosystem II stability/assembly factor-like uncharacterized protein